MAKWGGGGVHRGVIMWWGAQRRYNVVWGGGWLRGAINFFWGGRLRGVIINWWRGGERGVSDFGVLQGRVPVRISDRHPDAPAEPRTNGETKEI